MHSGEIGRVAKGADFTHSGQIGRIDKGMDFAHFDRASGLACHIKRWDISAMRLACI